MNITGRIALRAGVGVLVAVGAATSAAGMTTPVQAAAVSAVPAGTGACTTGKFCLWEKTNYDGQLLVRISPVPGGRSVGLSNYGALSGYNATNQGQRVWEAYRGGRCVGRSVPIPRYTHFADISKSGLYHGVGCITHS